MPFHCAVTRSRLAVHAVLPRQCLLYAPVLIAPAVGLPGQRKKPFHSSATLRDEQIDNSRNHYETLKLQPGATPADIKKSFYALSKTHHPDHNPSNPHASQRFMRISEAYSVLSIPAKRAAYDRDTLRLSAHQHQNPSSSSSSSSHPPHRGSYSSTSNPAGGRPASGLSRRRGTFQGPPPSFFRSGGWGAHGAKRSAAHEQSTGSSSASHSSSSSSSSSSHTSSANANANASNAGGMGPGQSPFHHADDVPHFDRVSHERTGRHSDRRRAARLARAEAEGGAGRGGVSSIEPERGPAGMFFLIGGVLLLSVLVPFTFGRMWRGSSGGVGGGGDKKGLEKKGKKS